MRHVSIPSYAFGAIEIIMTKTLQDKIDAIFRNPISEHWTAHQTNKAIQELREQINLYIVQCKRLSPNNSEIRAMIDAYENILALIGEKKND